MRLFLKIFLSYWIAQALFVVLAILVTLMMRPSNEISAVQTLQPKFLSEAVQAYQTGGAEDARKYLRSVHDAHQIRLFLFDEQGHELTGRKPPEWIENVEKGRTRTADSFWGRLGPGHFLRSSMRAADRHTYTLVIEFPPEHHGMLGVHEVPGLGIVIAIISSGLVCYFLAKYVTAPVVRLRAATQRLASGEALHGRAAYLPLIEGRAVELHLKAWNPGAISLPVGGFYKARRAGESSEPSAAMNFSSSPSRRTRHWVVGLGSGGGGLPGEDASCATAVA